MNATHTMDHLQVLTHVGTVLNAQATTAGTPTVSKPKTAATTHYDREGKDVASLSNTSYENVVFAADGKIASGNLKHESSDPSGIKLSTTAIGFQNGGTPVSANVIVHNLDGNGDYKHVAMDMTGVAWNESFHIGSGQVTLTTTDAQTQQKKHDGIIKFDKETMVSGSFTHYDPKKDNVVSGYSEIDYTSAKFLGMVLTGGEYSIRSLNADKVLGSTSQVALSALGRIQTIQTTNLDPKTAAIKSKVTVDFSKMNFNARNKFDTGDINYTVNDHQGVLMSATTVTYNKTFPMLSTTQVYEKEQLQNKIIVDYSQSQFNNSRKVINSSKKISVYAADGKLVSSTDVAYDGQGNKIDTTDGKPLDKAPARQPLSPLKVAAPMLPLADPPAGSTTKEDKVTRADGTLQKLVVTTMQGQTPLSSIVTIYGLDGATVIKTHRLDLSKLAYDAGSNTVTGPLSMQSHIGETVLHAESVIQY